MTTLIAQAAKVDAGDTAWMLMQPDPVRLSYVDEVLRARPGT